MIKYCFSLQNTLTEIKLCPAVFSIILYRYVESVFTEILFEHYLLVKQEFNSSSIEHTFS